MSSQVIYVKEVDLSDMPPVTVPYFMQATGIKKGTDTVRRWMKTKKILTDKETGKILFSEIIKFKKVA